MEKDHPVVSFTPNCPSFHYTDARFVVDEPQDTEARPDEFCPDGIKTMYRDKVTEQRYFRPRCCDSNTNHQGFLCSCRRLYLLYTAFGIYIHNLSKD